MSEHDGQEPKKAAPGKPTRKAAPRESTRKAAPKTGDQAFQAPGPGQGARSLSNWQSFAAARRAISGSEDARGEFKKDPLGFMRRHGVDMGNMASFGQTAEWSELQLDRLETASADADMELAFCKVWGCVVVVAAAAAAAVAAANVAAAANAAVAANALTVVNVVTNVRGDGE